MSASRSEAAGGPLLIHATAIAMSGRSVLIRGPSGAGKSDLALRCLATAPNPLFASPASLVSDDQVQLERRGGDLVASAPASIRGKLEVRGLGIVPVVPSEPCSVALVADLVSGAEVQRYPLTAERVEIAGVSLPLIRLAAFEMSAPIKLLLALAGTAARPP